MSYCRFSSMNFMCDVYVYADYYGGFTTHVAGNRYAFRPLPSFRDIVPFPSGFAGTWDKDTRTVKYPVKWKQRVASVYSFVFAQWAKVSQFTLDHIPKRSIRLPHAGKRFNDPTAIECANRLVGLRNTGYVVPQYAIDALIQESLCGQEASK